MNFYSIFKHSPTVKISNKFAIYQEFSCEKFFSLIENAFYTFVIKRYSLFRIIII